MLTFAAAFNGALLAVLPRRDRARISVRTTLWTIVAFGVFTIGGNFGVAGALGRLGPGLTGTILQVQIFLVAIGARLFLAERITRGFLLGAALAVGGFVVLARPGSGGAPIDPVGIGFALLGATSFAAILIWTRSVIHRIDPVTVNVARLAVAAGVLACLPGQYGAALVLDGWTWLMIACAAALGPVVSRLCLMFAARHLSASRTKLITLVSPVLAFLLEWAVLERAPSWHEVAGGGLILLGVLVPSLLALRADRARGEAQSGGSG